MKCDNDESSGAEGGADEIDQLETLHCRSVPHDHRQPGPKARIAPGPGAAPDSAAASVSIAGNLIMGKKDAPVTMIEFSDYQCPFCRRFFETTLPTLKAEYVETGKVRYVFRDFPLDQIHPHARKAAEAAHCAGDQGKYWEIHARLFQNPKARRVGRLKTNARSLLLNGATFDARLDRSKYAAEVQKDFDDGMAVGVRGTPSFFVGKTRSDDTIQGVFLSGALPTPIFRQAIDNALREH